MKSIIPWLKDKKDAGTPREWLQHFWEHPLTNLNLMSERVFANPWPAVDIAEDDHTVSIKAEIPGMEQQDLDISYQDGVLTLKGEKKEEQEEKKKDTYYRESYYGRFCRSIPLGDNMEWDKASAMYKQGLLTITVPKKEGAAKKVSIKVEA